jgi:hypothetical protein
MNTNKTAATYTDFSRNGVINARMRIINKLLLHDVLTRKELSERLDISIASATNHTQDLIANEILLSETIPGIKSKRPIQKLSLNGNLGLCATLFITPEAITVEILKLDTTLIEKIKVPVKSATQKDVLSALVAAVAKAQAIAENLNNEIIAGMIGLKGTASPPNKAIFSVEGVPDWEPCSPFWFLDIFKSNQIYNLSTWIMAKCKGFSKHQQCDHNIGIVEFSNNTFHISAIHNEKIELGHLGTSSPFLHCEVENGLPCYCGKSNCFNAYISNGGFDPEVINEGLNNIFSSQSVDMSIVGLEFKDHPETAKKLCDNGLNAKAILIENGDELYRQGLGILAAENSWKIVLNKLFSKTNK